MNTVSASEWETAWGEYLDALSAWEAARRVQFKRGHRREYKRITREFIAAKDRLRVLDPEFCERMGI